MVPNPHLGTASEKLRSIRKQQMVGWLVAQRNDFHEYVGKERILLLLFSALS